jgi:hypothetical protein
LQDSDISPGIPIPYHEIPNAKLGVWGVESPDSILGTIHVFFPALARTSKQPRLTQLSEDEVRQFYERGLKPSMAQLVENLDWPAEYISGPRNTPGTDGEDSHAGPRDFRFATLPPVMLANFASNLRIHLQRNGVEWADKIFFVHTVCGMKSATTHLKKKDAARLAWIKALERAQIPLEATDQGSWWIDVGLEFRSDDPGCYLQWTTASHDLIVQKVLGVSMSTAMRITTLGHDGYSRDIVCHLSEVSGCRLETGIRHGGPFHAAYLELSTTSISGAQHPAVPALTVPQVMDVGRWPHQTAIDLLSAFSAQKNSQNWLQSNAARVELRVPLEHAEDVLIDIDEDTIRESLLSFSRQEWM